ncbi:MAG: murein L,D-transpeptidase family protein [Candidatus Methylumidiphilus sp.]
MKPTRNALPVLVLALLVAACAGHKPDDANQAALAKPSAKPRMNAYRPLKLPGQWTVEDVLADFGGYSVAKLQPYFAKAKVPYPPQAVVLLALKEERRLELWARGDGEFRLIRDYDIQAASGRAGPKLRQGDKQVPESVYRIVGLNPNSHYHLSMKLDYPNAFDLYHADLEGRYNPGSDIFIHGKAASIGCLAMGDENIEELFVLTAQTGKENVKVVIAPHDPRQQPLDPYADGLPPWASELYSTITEEIQALSPVSVSTSGR